MSFRRWRKAAARLAARTAAPTAALCLLAGAGTAYAYWGTVGSGTNSATNAGMQTVSVTALIAGDGPQTTLIPGGTADVVLRVTNANPYAVQIRSITANGAVTTDTAHPTCTTTGVTFTPPAVPLTPTVSVPANSSLLITLTGAATMSSLSQSVCQGAIFSVPVTVEARK